MKITIGNHLTFGLIGIWLAWILGTIGGTLLSIISGFCGLTLVLGWWLILAAKP